MRPRYLLIVLISCLFFASFLVLRASGFFPPRRDAETDPPLAAQDAPVENVDLEVNTEALNTATPEMVSTQATSLKDGSAILEDHCAQCHLAKWLAQIKKSRVDWLATLAKMEGMGARLDDSEKEILIEYFTALDQP